MQRYKILTIGGGTGQFVLLSGLRDIPDIQVTSVVSMVDSGGSTGRLRDELGILPPGDILKCILALSPSRDIVRRLFLSRFEKNERLRGHNIGNMLLSSLTQYTGSFSEGVAALAETLGTRGEILPVTVDRATLVAELTDGSRIFGESAIDLPRGDQREKIKRTYLVPHHSDTVSVYPPVLEAIREADFIIIGPGDLYTSIIPNFIVPGVAEAIRVSRARLIYNLNIMTKFGETDGFDAEAFVKEVEEHVGRPIDVVTVNSTPLSGELLSRYHQEKAKSPAVGNKTWFGERQLLETDLLDTRADVARHDENKLAKTLLQVIRES